jgi:hypothetical protein
MMGQQPRTDSLFYYFRLEDQIPDDHFEDDGKCLKMSGLTHG